MTNTNHATAREWRAAFLTGQPVAEPTWLADWGWPGGTTANVAAFIEALFEVVKSDQAGSSAPPAVELSRALRRHFPGGTAGPEALLRALGMGNPAGLETFLEAVDGLRDQMLTYLEVWEAQQTRYGLFDTRMTGWDLISGVPATPEVQWDTLYLARELALRYLMADRQLLPLQVSGPVGTWVIRSRMAELVRLIVNLRQRFPEHARHTQSPRLVRDVKFEAVPREVPNRTIELSDFLDRGLAAVMAASPRPREQLTVARNLLAAVLQADGKTRFAPFQLRAFQRIITRAMDPQAGPEPEGTVVGAGTGSGKTLAYFVPALYQVILEKLLSGVLGTKTIAIYPRTKLAEKQFEEFLGLAYHANRLYVGPTARRVTVALDYGQIPYDWEHLFREPEKLKWEPWPAHNPRGLLFPAAGCPHPGCGGQLYLLLAAEHDPTQRQLRCTNPSCGADISFDFVLTTKEQMAAQPPDILVAVTESLNDRLMSPAHQSLFGDDHHVAPSLIMVDEIHLHTALKGMQVGYLLRRLRARLAAAPEAARGNLQFVGLSATIADAEEFFSELTGVSRYRIRLEEPNREAGETRVSGAEYYLFVKPHVSGDTAVLSTLIQTAMAVVHNMWQPEPPDQYKTFGFVNSLDIAYRWKERMQDAESNRRLYELRAPSQIAANTRLQEYFYARQHCSGCPGGPRSDCLLFQEGECWWFMEHGRGISQPMNLDVVTSRGGQVQGDLVVATSSLEVGYDDASVMAVIQYLSPHNTASFVQRKGRGGRIVGTRPLMVTILSPYRATDIFNFQNHHRLMDPRFRKLPLNPQNRLVRRIHGFYALMDWLALRAAANGVAGLSSPSLNRSMLEFVKTETNRDNLLQFRDYLARAFGMTLPETNQLLSDGLDGILAVGLRRLVRRAEQYFAQNPTYNRHLKYLMDDYLPPNFFSDINLPELTIQDEQGKDLEHVRVGLGLNETSLGKVSFRLTEPYWVPLASGQPLGARTLAVPVREHWETNPLYAVSGTRVPERVRQALGETGLSEQLPVLRPNLVRVVRLRQPGRRGNGDSAWSFDPDTGLVYPQFRAPHSAVPLSDRTTSYPLSFYDYQFNPNEFDHPLVAPRHLGLFATGNHGAGITGLVPISGSPWLKLYKVYAGAEATLRGQRGDEWSWTVTYAGENGEPVALGFAMETEGLAVELHRELGRLVRPGPGLLAELRYNWLQHQSYRWAQITGTNPFAVQRALDILLTMVGLEGGDRTEVVNRWAAGELDDAFRRALQLTYGFLSPRNREQVLDLAATLDFRAAVQEAAQVAFGHPPADFLRDVAAHTLKHALKRTAQSLAGVDSAEDISGWVQLGVDYPRPNSEVLLFEMGMYGTGAMRSLHAKLKAAPEEFWREVEQLVTACPVATEEELLRQVLQLPENRLEELARLVRAVADAPGPAERTTALAAVAGWFREHGGGFVLTPESYRGLRRLFIRPLEVHGLPLTQPIENWALYREVESFYQELSEQFGRPPTEHEVTALLQERLGAGDAYPALRSLLDLYRANRHDYYTNLVGSLETNLRERPYYREFVVRTPSLDEIHNLAEQSEDARRAILMERYGVGERWVAGFDEALFSTLGEGLTYAEVYWRLHYQQLTPELRAAIEEALVRSSIQDAISRRLLHTCHDGCPDCIGGSCDLEPSLTARLTLSRRLLAGYLEQQKERWQVRLNPEHPEAAVNQLERLLTEGAARAYLRYSAGEEAVAAQVVAQLKARDVRLPDDRVYVVEVYGTGVARLNLAGRCEYEIAVQLRGEG